MSIARFISFFAFAGVFVPLLFQAAWRIIAKYLAIDLKIWLGFMKFMLVLWPSSLMLLPAGSDESLFPVALLISIAVNVVLYVAIGAAIWCGLRKHKMILVLFSAVLTFIWWHILTL